MSTATQALIDELYRIKERAEIVDGGIVIMSPTGGLPSSAGGVIYASLRQHQRTVGGGWAYPDGAGFLVDLPNRKSFSPDAALHKGPKPTMKFIDGAPLFAAEVRSENEYTPRAEQALARKRADYFAAGTLVVWDIDLVGPDTVRSYRVGEAEPKIYRRGEIAEAEPAVPGWRFPVDELFE
jgi:Uma2 family endonuclease